MSVILGPCGFCAGVENAINTALAAAEEYGKVYTLHSLIHNKRVTDELSKKNIVLLGENENLPKGATVVISAHGCADGKITELKNQGYNVVDATCPFVKKIHAKIIEYAQMGWCTVVVGDKNHAEVIGSLGCGLNSQAVESADGVDFSVGDKYFISVQTTYPKQKYLEIKKNIKNRAVNLLKTVEFFDSFCYTTIDRQLRAEKIASECDFIIVVGDKNSSNCMKLYDTAKKFCSDVVFIENVSDLQSLHRKNLAKSGILSGASTPKELTMEVFNRMSDKIVINEVDEANNEAVVAEEVKEEKKPTGEITSMEEAMKLESASKVRNYREGMRLKARVVKADVTGITVTIDGGGKNDCGFIAKEEAEIDGTYDIANYKVDDVIEAIVIPKEKSGDKSINLSKKAYDQLKLDDEKVKSILAGEEFTLVCTQEIKGGLLGKIGTYTVFVPASQIRIGYVKNLADYVNKTLRLKALPPKEEYDEEGNLKKPRNPKRIVASQKVILEAEKAAKEEEFWSKVYEGAIVNGKVKRFASFGAFVSLKYMDALVHNSDLSWSRKQINDPSEILELYKNYDFIVLSTDREKGRISLGYKQLQKRPIEIAQEKYPVDTVLKGKVVRIVKFGAFVEIEPGIDGLVHISQISRNRIETVNEVLKEGDEVEVKVLPYEGDRINLTMKELLPVAPVEETDEEYSKPSRTASFNSRLDKQEKGERKEKKPRKVKEEGDGEPREYVTGGSGVTIGDLLKIDFSDKD